MNTPGTFKRGLKKVCAHWEKEDYGAALSGVERLKEEWPGNAYLHVLRASLVQLQEQPKHGLEEAKRALHEAVELDGPRPAASIEFGYFLDNVEDNPDAASKPLAEGVAKARRLLIEALIGQAKAFLQLGKRQDAERCLAELRNSVHFDPETKMSKSDETAPDITFESPSGRVYMVQLRGPFADQIEELLGEVRNSPAAAPRIARTP
jgi:hypothetical protein